MGKVDTKATAVSELTLYTRTEPGGYKYTPGAFSTPRLSCTTAYTTPPPMFTKRAVPTPHHGKMAILFDSGVGFDGVDKSYTTTLVAVDGSMPHT
jgi:hypothetical protein